MTTTTEQLVAAIQDVEDGLTRARALHQGALAQAYAEALDILSIEWLRRKLPVHARMWTLRKDQAALWADLQALSEVAS